MNQSIDQTSTTNVHHASSPSRRAEGKRRRRRYLRQPPRIWLNLTTIIDVIFLLLIYFGVTASFAMDEGVISAKFPQGQTVTADPRPPDKSLNIIVGSLGTTDYRLRIEGVARRPVDFVDLIAMLEQLQQHPRLGRNGPYPWDTTPVLIKPEDKVRWQHVVNAFNAAVKAQYRKVAFARAASQSFEDSAPIDQ